jgi:FlaA1/EpsC-like NDP-sugar epimerase
MGICGMMEAGTFVMRNVIESEGNMQYTSLADKTVVITGATSGIGKLAAEEFLKCDAKVVLAARSLENT